MSSILDPHLVNKMAVPPEFIMDVSKRFDEGVTGLKAELQKALDKLAGVGGTNSNTSDPVILAQYQAALAAYTTFCNAQSSSVKAFKDIASATISNFR